MCEKFARGNDETERVKSVFSSKFIEICQVDFCSKMRLYV